MSGPSSTASPDAGLLDNARREALARGLDDFPIVDVDAHHFEFLSWREIVKYIDHPTTRLRAEETLQPGGGAYTLWPLPAGNQHVSGRIRRRRPGGSGPVDGALHDLEQFRAAMASMGIDYSIVFPTAMLTLGLHPQVEVEVAIARAYARWMAEEILPRDHHVLTMLYLPFNDEGASLRMIEEFGGTPGVVGFMVTALRYQPVHHNKYMKVYAALEERGLPLCFHPIYNWGERGLEQLNRFLSVHAIGFPLYNMIHLTNIVINGIPERFPRLRFVWLEAGVAWIPFLMLRLDNEYMMRPSEAPQLKRKPSDYMREFYYTTQPLEYADNPSHLQAMMEMIGGETQLLYSSDYRHWDFDLPTRVYDLPFLSETAKRQILGGNAIRLFRLDER